MNCNIGDRNGLTMQNLIKLVLKHSRNNPSQYTMLYPHLHVTSNAAVHGILEAFHTFLPAYAADLVLKLLGKKTMMVKVQNKIKAAAKAGKCQVITI